MTPARTDSAPFRAIVDTLQAKHRFVISSHARPDGDSIGSALALAYALRALGKEARVVMADRAPEPLLAFPGVPDIEVIEVIDAGRMVIEHPAERTVKVPPVVADGLVERGLAEQVKGKAGRARGA